MLRFDLAVSLIGRIGFVILCGFMVSTFRACLLRYKMVCFEILAVLFCNAIVLVNSQKSGVAGNSVIFVNDQNSVSDGGKKRA